MKQLTGQKRSAWFWVGVALLSLSALLWVLLFLMKPYWWSIIFYIGAALWFSAIPVGIGIACIMRRRPPREKSPWGSGTIWTASLIGSFAVGGIIAGLNWGRMERHLLMWLTTIMSVVAAIVWTVFAWMVLPWHENIIEGQFISSILGAAFAWAMWRWQKGYHSTWQEAHALAERAGWKIPTLIIIIYGVFMAGYFLLANQS